MLSSTSQFTVSYYHYHLLSHTNLPNIFQHLSPTTLKMRFSTQASTVMAVLCLSAPALASIVNAAPIPEPLAVEARDPSLVSTITEGVEDAKKIGGAVNEAVQVGDTVVKGAKNLWNDVFHHGGSQQQQQQQQQQQDQQGQQGQ